MPNSPLQSLEDILGGRIEYDEASGQLAVQKEHKFPIRVFSIRLAAIVILMMSRSPSLGDFHSSTATLAEAGESSSLWPAILFLKARLM